MIEFVLGYAFGLLLGLLGIGAAKAIKWAARRDRARKEMA